MSEVCKGASVPSPQVLAESLSNRDRDPDSVYARRVKKLPRLTAAIPMENPYCSCKLTRVRPRCR